MIGDGPHQDSPSGEAPAGTDSRFVTILKFLGWLLLGILGPITPWFQPLFKYGLISEYYYPQLNPLASTFAVIAFAICYLHCKNDSKERLLRYLWRPVGLLFVFSFLVCLVLSLTIGEVWEPGVALGLMIRVVWTVLYLLIFISLSCILSLLGLLFVGKK